MKTQQFEIRVELYVGGISKSKQYYYYSDEKKMNEQIKSLLKFVIENKDLYVDEYKEVGNRTIISVPSLSNETHYFIVAKIKEVIFNEEIKL